MLTLFLSIHIFSHNICIKLALRNTSSSSMWEKSDLIWNNLWEKVPHSMTWAACGKNMLYLESGKKCPSSKWAACGKNMLYLESGKKVSQFRMNSLWEKTCSIWKSGKKRPSSKWAACGKNMLYLECGKKATQSELSSCGKNMLCFKCGKKATQFRMSSCGKNMLCFKWEWTACGKNILCLEWEKRVLKGCFGITIPKALALLCTL